MSKLLRILRAIEINPLAARKAKDDISIFVRQQFLAASFQYGSDGVTKVYSQDVLRTLYQLFKMEFEAIKNEEDGIDQPFKHLGNVSFIFYDLYYLELKQCGFDVNAEEMKEKSEKKLKLDSIIQAEPVETTETLIVKLNEIYEDYKLYLEGADLTHRTMRQFYNYSQFSEYNKLYFKLVDLLIKDFLDCLKTNNLEKFFKYGDRILNSPYDHSTKKSPYYFLYNSLLNEEKNVLDTFCLAATIFHCASEIDQKTLEYTVEALLRCRISEYECEGQDELKKQIYERAFYLVKELAILVPDNSFTQNELLKANAPKRFIHFLCKAISSMHSEDSFPITSSTFHLSLEELSNPKASVEPELNFRILEIKSPIIGYGAPSIISENENKSEPMSFGFSYFEDNKNIMALARNEGKQIKQNKGRTLKINNYTAYGQLWYQLAKQLTKYPDTLGKSFFAIEQMRGYLDQEFTFGIKDYKGAAIPYLKSAIACGLYYYGRLGYNSIFSDAIQKLKESLNGAAEFILSDYGLSMHYGKSSIREKLTIDILEAQYHVFKLLPRDEIIMILNHHIQENNNNFLENITRLRDRAIHIYSRINLDIHRHRNHNHNVPYTVQKETVELALTKHLLFKTPNLIFDTLFFKAMAVLARDKTDLTYAVMNKLLNEVFKASAELENQIMNAFKGDKKIHSGLLIFKMRLITQSEKKLVQCVGAVLAAGYDSAELSLTQDQLIGLTQNIIKGLYDKLGDTKNTHQAVTLFLPIHNTQGIAVKDFNIYVPTANADNSKISISQKDIQAWIRPVMEKGFKLEQPPQINPVQPIVNSLAHQLRASC